jgi:hypothetical protein
MASLLSASVEQVVGKTTTSATNVIIKERPHKKINKFEKQKQGEIIRKFILQMLSSSKLTKYMTPVDYLCSGSGVLDIAGGNGWVSLSLALHGIKSTVIDASPSVGCLPGRYRKFLRRAVEGKLRKTRKTILSNDGNHEQKSPRCHPNNVEYDDVNELIKPIMYDKYQAYFTSNIDHYSNNKDGIPICNINTNDIMPLLNNCSFVVGLHPDQATGAIVEFAVKHKKPFLVVPCCVFSRLFPNRFVPNNVDGEKNVVSTKKQLIDWCVSLDPENINISELPFQGSNIAVWATFD